MAFFRSPALGQHDHIVGVAGKAMPAPFEFMVEFIEQFPPHYSGALPASGRRSPLSFHVRPL